MDISSSNACPGETQDSIYLLLQEQKDKYRGLIDRLSHDNKRKSYSIELLKNQLDLIKKALSLAGLELDMKELQSLVSNRVKEKADNERKNENIIISNEPDVIMESGLVPKPPKEPEHNMMQIPVSLTETNYSKQSSHFQETQSQITKSYIEHVLKLNRESLLPNHENVNRKDNIIKPRKYPKEGTKVSLDHQDLSQELESSSDPAKTVFNGKEPLPPIHSDDKVLKIETKSILVGIKEVSLKKSEEMAVKPKLEDFDATSLNRWKNDADGSIVPEPHSILELLNGHKSLINDKTARKQKIREKRQKGL